MSKAAGRKVERLTDDRRHFVEENLNLVDYIIQKQLHISVYDTYYEDYQQEGRVGLIMASIRFDESRGFAFSTFAAQYIIGMVKRFRRDFVRGEIKVPRKVLDLVPRVMNLYLEGYTYEEISGKLNLSSDEYQVYDGHNVGTAWSLGLNLVPHRRRQNGGLPGFNRIYSFAGAHQQAAC